jgi:hypothetical protein
MPLSARDLLDHLAALRASLVENQWAATVDEQLLALFRLLLRSAKELDPQHEVLRLIDPPKQARPKTLLALVDQIVVAIHGPAEPASHSSRAWVESFD